jgi:hypothetical protein
MPAAVKKNAAEEQKKLGSSDSRERPYPVWFSTVARRPSIAARPDSASRSGPVSDASINTARSVAECAFVSAGALSATARCHRWGKRKRVRHSCHRP